MDPSTAADAAKKVSNGDDHVKAGYWFCTSNYPIEGLISKKLFNHLYAGFAKVQCPPGEDVTQVIQFPKDYQQNFETFPKTVKRGKTGVKAILSIGGGDAYVPPSDVQPDISKTIATLVASADDVRQAFIDKSIELATTNSYDGLDLCWLQHSSEGYQDPNLASLLKAWHEKCKKSKLLLTATILYDPANVSDGTGGTNFNYPFGDISASLDWINVLAFDFYDPFRTSTSLTGPVHAWENPNDPTRSGKEGMEKWAQTLFDSKKIVLGLPFYGRQWRLDDPDEHGFFARASSAGLNHQYLDYKFIHEEYIVPHPKKFLYDEKYVAAYWTYGTTWIGFDEENCISTKVLKAKNKNLRGYCAWHVGADDDKWDLSTAASTKWP